MNIALLAAALRQVTQGWQPQDRIVLHTCNKMMDESMSWLVLSITSTLQKLNRKIRPPNVLGIILGHAVEYQHPLSKTMGFSHSEGTIHQLNLDKISELECLHRLVTLLANALQVVRLL